MTSNSVAQSAQDITLPNIPELYDPNFLDALLPVSKVAAAIETVTNPMLDALKVHSHRTHTENSAQALSSTESASLDAFSQLGSWSFSPDLDKSLFAAWDEDPELTLKLIWNLRSIHEGKNDREVFYRAFGWLYKNHPRTAISNLDQLVRAAIKKKSKAKEGSAPIDDSGLAHGYWKDLLNILALANLNQLADVKKAPAFLHSAMERTEGSRKRAAKKDKKPDSKPREPGEATTPQKPLDPKQVEANKQAQAKARESRDNKFKESHALLLKNLKDPKFLALYVAVARLFADQLVEDLKTSQALDQLPSGHEDRQSTLRKISLASKWAPTPLQSHDKVTNVSTAVALLLNHNRDAVTTTKYRFPSSITSQPNPESAEQMLVLRSFFQRHILTPLRAQTRVTEPLMTANRWSSIQYNRVASVCMKNNTERFFMHDKDRFKDYLKSVEEQKTTISGATLLPHELVKQALQLSTNDKESKALQEVKKELAETQGKVIGAQWNTLVSNLRDSGTLDNCLALCDVSGSMGSLEKYRSSGNSKSKSRKSSSAVEPILPAVALSLVLCQLAKPPFANSFITFSEEPKFAQVDPRLSLLENIDSMCQEDWGMNTDFKAVFVDLLLPLAKKHNVKNEDMIKRLFVFSDMQFDAVEPSSEEYESDGCGDRSGKVEAEWNTNHDVISKAYKELTPS